MTRVRGLNVVILYGSILLLSSVPHLSGANDGFSMIIASDPQFYWSLMPADECIRNNQLVLNAMNHIGEHSRWPGRDSSKLIYGYDSPVVHPTGVIINGDLTMDWTYIQTQEFKNWHERIAYPTYPGLGNHDYFNNTPLNNYHFYYQLERFAPWDPYRSGKEAVWWMADQMETGSISNIVRTDLIGYVGLKNGLATGRCKIGVRYCYRDPGEGKLVDSVVWSDPIPAGPTAFPSEHPWGFVQLSENAVEISIAGESESGWEILADYIAPEPWEARCYEVYFEWGYHTRAITRPSEWPGGNLGSLAYSFDIGPYYHFVQLQRKPDYSATFPSKEIGNPFAANTDDVFYRHQSPEVSFSTSYAWLERDLRAATDAGKYIVINVHEDCIDARLEEIIADRNVVAMFFGHDHYSFGHDGNISNTYNDSVYDIPKFCSGSTNLLRFLVAMFQRDYFNVAVFEVDSVTGQGAFVMDTSAWLAETFMIPELFAVGSGTVVTDSLED